MRNGETIVFDFYKAKPNFKKELTDEETFPAELVFDFDKWRDWNTYMKYVREDEKFGPGGMNKGSFAMIADKTYIAMITNLTEKEDLDEFVAGIPCSENFRKIIIE